MSLLTRREAVKVLNDEGFPTGESTFEKVMMPSRDEERPPIALVWGNRHLYEREAILAWARNRAEKHTKRFRERSSSPAA